MKILLTSAGMRMKDQIEEFVAGVIKPVRVLHVITASKRERIKDYVHQDIFVMNEMGWEVTDIDLDDKNESELKKTLTQTDVVYVQGGNTYDLLMAIRKSGFEKAVRGFLEHGGRYIGVSAGTLVAGNDIRKGEDPADNKIGLTDFTGMKLVNYIFEVHCEVASRLNDLIGLTDDQALLIDGDKIELVER